MRALARATPVGVVALAFVACATTLPVGPVDRAATITREDFAAWLEPHGLETLKEKLRKRRSFGAYTLSYEYQGESESLMAILNSEVMILRNPADAHRAYRSLGWGLRLGADELEPVETTLDWAEESQVYRIHTEGRQIGNAYVGRRGHITVAVVLAGLYSSDPALFEERIAAGLARLASYDPVPAETAAAMPDQTGFF